MTDSEQMRIALRARRESLPRINWLALLAVVVGLTVVAAWGGLW